MSLTYESDVKVDSASVLGVTLLGQLVRHLNEARYVLGFVTGEVHLSLDDLSSALDHATREANQAFEAASLLLRGAALDASWGRRASRPAAIFARHNAAIRGGAALVLPAEAPMLICSEPSSVSPDGLPPKPAGATRPLCGRPTKTTGKPCENKVVVLENGALASGCALVSHLPHSERASYERQKAQTAAWHEASSQYQRSDRQRMMTEAAALWLRRQSRELAIGWDMFCRDVGIADSVAARAPAVDADETSLPCEACEPLFVDDAAHASVAMNALHNWAIEQPLPRWADKSLPPGHWLFQTPPKAHAESHELSLHISATLFGVLATPPEAIARAVDARHHEIVKTVLAQFAHEQTVLPRKHTPPLTPAGLPRQPQARPASQGRTKKKRKKR